MAALIHHYKSAGSEELLSGFKDTRSGTCLRLVHQLTRVTSCLKCCTRLGLVWTGETGLHVPGRREVRGHLLHLLPEGGGRRFGQGLEALWGDYHRTSQNCWVHLTFLLGSDFTHTSSPDTTVVSGIWQLIRACRDEANIKSANRPAHMKMTPCWSSR